MNDKGQAQFFILLMLMVLCLLFFNRLFQLEQMTKRFSFQHKKLLCAKNILNRRLQHAKEVVKLNRIILGVNTGHLIPGWGTSIESSKRLLQRMQELSLLRYRWHLIKNVDCETKEKILLSIPVFDYSHRSPGGFLNYNQTTKSFIFLLPGETLWFKEENGPTFLTYPSYQIKTYSVGRAIGKSLITSPSSAFLLGPLSL